VVDDDEVVRRSCERILSERHDLMLAATGRDGLAALGSEPFDLALVDLKLPDVGGLEILREAPDRFPDVPIIIITGYSTVKSAVEAVKTGAFDYISKPFTPDELEAAVEKAVRQRRLLRDRRELQEALADRYEISSIVGESAAMMRVLALVKQVAGTDSTVLVTGESGTGKELVARAIHFSSARREGRFVAVDCGAVEPSLIASELFGHVKGAFTGASADREGLVKTADRGTLFLDEVANLSLDHQATLLRVIETMEVRAVGASDAVKVDVRYVAATNRELARLVGDGKFREDLYYRLNVFPIQMPSLRERREDVPLLARHFLARFSARMHKRIDDFTPEAMDLLVRYDWPGNVRELSNVVERLVILTAGGSVGQARLLECFAVPPAGGGPAGPAVPRTAEELNAARKSLREEAVAELERAFLIEALRRNDYNDTRAAEETGMQRSNLQALLRRHGLRMKDILPREGVPPQGDAAPPRNDG